VGAFKNFFVELFSGLGQTLVEKKHPKGSLVTTIDPSVQAFAEATLEKVKNDYNSKTSGVIIMNPKNGEIYALALNPDFDLNDFGIREDLHNILRSDILRYHMLYYIGGVWSDFDVIWLKPIEHLNNITNVNIVHSIGMSVNFYKNNYGHHSIGILIACKKHLFYRKLIETVNDIQSNPQKQKHTSYNIKGKQFYHQSFGVVLWNKMYPKLSDILGIYKDCLGIKYKTFYFKKFIAKAIKLIAIGIPQTLPCTPAFHKSNPRTEPFVFFA
jgi:hypothetical protein